MNRRTRRTPVIPAGYRSDYRDAKYTPWFSIPGPVMPVHHHETHSIIATTDEQLFAHVDDPASLSSHMQQSSWRMGGGHMNIELDAGRGQAVGSVTRLSGRVLGLPLWLEEQVIQREPPFRKQWQTTAPPKLWVIGHYRMGFELAPAPQGTLLRVFIDYELPGGWIARWLGWMPGAYYARWCTQRMVSDAVSHFVSPTLPLSRPP